jgi:hypothetical protein
MLGKTQSLRILMYMCIGVYASSFKRMVGHPQTLNVHSCIEKEAQLVFRPYIRASCLLCRETFNDSQPSPHHALPLVAEADTRPIPD